MVGLKDNDSSDHTDIVSLFVIVLCQIFIQCQRVYVPFARLALNFTFSYLRCKTDIDEILIRPRSLNKYRFNLDLEYDLMSIKSCCLNFLN